MKRKPKPPVSILSPEFQYVDAANTNIGKTFERIRKERAERAALQSDADVVPIRKKVGE